MDEYNFLGPNLQPPNGGLQHLQSALNNQHASRFHAWQKLAVGIAASLVMLTIVFMINRSIQERRTEIILQKALTAAPQTSFEQGAYVELPSPDPNIKILLVGNLYSQTKD